MVLQGMVLQGMVLQGMPWSYCGAWWGADDNCRTRTNFTEDPEVKAAAKLVRWKT